MASEGKAHRPNKDKLKAVLVVINSMDNEDLGEVGSTPKSIQLPSPHTNSGTPLLGLSSQSVDVSNLVVHVDSVCQEKQCSPLRSEISSDERGFSNSILSWDSNEDFRGFCSKIGIFFNSNGEAGNFSNLVRSEQSLSSVNLDQNLDCIERFKALFFQWLVMIILSWNIKGLEVVVNIRK